MSSNTDKNRDPDPTQNPNKILWNPKPGPEPGFIIFWTMDPYPNPLYQFCKTQKPDPPQNFIGFSSLLLGEDNRPIGIGKIPIKISPEKGTFVNYVTRILAILAPLPPFVTQNPTNSLCNVRFRHSRHSFQTTPKGKTASIIIA